MHRALTLFTALVLAFVVTAPAAAATRTGSATDPQDVPTSSRDILAFAGSADDTGTMGAAVRLRAPLVGPDAVQVRVGTKAGTDCAAPYVLFTAGTAKAVWQREDATSDADVAPAKVVYDGATITVTAQDSVAHAAALNCAEAGTTADGTSYFDTTGVADLISNAPSPPPPPPTATAPPPPPPPPPATTTASTPPVAVAKGPKLTVSLAGAPRIARRNRTITLKLRIANDGSKPTGKLTITRPTARGLSVVRLTRSLAALKPAQKRTVTLRVRLTRRARSATSVRLTVRSGKLKASSAVQLRLTAPKAVKAAPGSKNPLVGTYWWRTVNHVDYAWDNRALYFVSADRVYSGFPKGGLPKSCTTPPAKPEEEVDERDGCLPYTYDATTGRVTIGEKVGSFKAGKLTLDEGEADYEATQIPKPKTRFDFKDHRQTSFTGTCGVYSFCTVSYKYLTLTLQGEFATASSSTTTGDTPTTFFSAGNYPPDQRGTYEVRAGGVLHLAFADGTVKDETFAIQTDYETGKPDAVAEGVLVGDTNFYPDPSP